MQAILVLLMDQQTFSRQFCGFSFQHKGLFFVKTSRTRLSALTFFKVQYAHIDKTYAFVLLNRSRLAHRTLHHDCKNCFPSFNCYQDVCHFSRFDCFSWQNGLVFNTKHVAHVQWCRSSLLLDPVLYHSGRVAPIKVIRHYRTKFVF